MKNCYIKSGVPCSLRCFTTVKRRLNFILDNLNNISNGSNILDLGTGLGTYISSLSQNPNVKFTGIDINRENLRRARSMINNKNVEFLGMSAENIAFKENEFQAVLMIEVLEHIPNDEKAIKEVYRILKPGGKLIITAPNKLFPFETHGFQIRSKICGTKGLGFPLLPYLPETLRRYIANARVYTPWSFRKMLIKNGFQINTIGFLGPSMDSLRTNFPKMEKDIDMAERLIDKMEHLPIKYFLTTILCCVEKVKT